MEYYSSKLVILALMALAVAASVVVVDAQNLPADYVNPHNTARSAPDVAVASAAWDTTVAAYAQNYANARKADCNLVHSTGGTYGENLFKGSAGYPWAAADAVNAWVGEKQWYNHATNTCATGKVCGHYTQVVWNTSTAIGCGRVVCDNNAGVFITCNYNPAGNIVGQSPY